MQIKTDLTKQVLAFYWLLNKVLCLVFFCQELQEQCSFHKLQLIPNCIVKWSTLQSVSDNKAIYTFHGTVIFSLHNFKHICLPVP